MSRDKKLWDQVHEQFIYFWYMSEIRTPNLKEKKREEGKEEGREGEREKEKQKEAMLEN